MYLTCIPWNMPLPYIWGWCTMQMTKVRLSVKISNYRLFSPDFLPRPWKLSGNRKFRISVQIGVGEGRVQKKNTVPQAGNSTCALFHWLSTLSVAQSLDLLCPAQLTRMQMLSPLLLPCFSLSHHSLSFLQISIDPWPSYLREGRINSRPVFYCKCVRKACLSTAKGHLVACPTWSGPFVNSNGKYINPYLVLV